MLHEHVPCEHDGDAGVEEWTVITSSILSMLLLLTTKRRVRRRRRILIVAMLLPVTALESKRGKDGEHHQWPRCS